MTFCTPSHGRNMGLQYHDKVENRSFPKYFPKCHAQVLHNMLDTRMPVCLHTSSQSSSPSVAMESTCMPVSSCANWCSTSLHALELNRGSHVYLSNKLPVSSAIQSCTDYSKTFADFANSALRIRLHEFALLMATLGGCRSIITVLLQWNLGGSSGQRLQSWQVICIACLLCSWPLLCSNCVNGLLAAPNCLARTRCPPPLTILGSLSNVVTQCTSNVAHV